MADTVQYQMERMVDELDDLEQRGLFSRREIAEIVRKRRDFEYRLKRRIPLKRDFLSYIEYESNLDALRLLRKRAIIGEMKKHVEEERDREDGEDGDGNVRKRKKDGKLWKRSISDTAGVRRIIEIYKRATVRFKGDLSLWFKYLEFCRTCRNGRMKQVLAEAIRFHPKVPGLWIYAAAWEFDENLNVAAARALMQGGLRACPDSEDLWIEYLRMELTYLNKLRARKVALGEDVSTLARKNNDTKETSEWKEEHKDLFMPLNGGKDESQNLDSQGMLEKKESFFWEHGSIILQTIYHGAIKAIPSRMSLRKRFLEILEEVDLAHSDELKEEILKDLRDKFSGDACYWDWLARFQVRGIEIGKVDVGGVPEALNKAIQIYEDALELMPYAEMYILYATFLIEIVVPDLANSAVAHDLANFDSSNNVTVENESLISRLLSVYQRAESKGCLNQDLAEQYILFYLRIGRYEDARELTHRFCGDKFSQSAKLWVLRVSIELKHFINRSINKEDKNSAFELVRSALTKVTMGEAKALWFMSVEIFSHRKKYFDKLVDCFVMLLARSGSDAVDDGLSSAIVDHVLQRDGVQNARETYKRLLALPHPSLLLFRHCIELETNLGVVDDKYAIGNARKLYESALIMYGDDRELWRSYYSLEVKVGTSETANAVFWRARKALGDVNELSH